MNPLQDLCCKGFMFVSMTTMVQNSNHLMEDLKLLSETVAA
jgi:hypothetical protein